MKHYLFFILLVGGSLSLSGCAGSYRSYYHTLEYVFTDKSINVTKEHVANSSIDLMHITVDGEIQAVVVLAFMDGDKYRWASGDNAIFTMHHGVIVQTEGLATDLHYTSHLNDNPLAGEDTLAYGWDRFVDVEGAEYGAPVRSTWRVEGESTQLFFDEPINTLKIIETVQFSNNTPYIRTDLSWENIYYLDANTKNLLSSKQKYHPDSRVYEMVYLSRAQRALAERSD